MQAFIDARYKNGKSLTDDEITGMLIAVLFAGQHTSSITSTWSGMYMLANKEMVMPQALDEQRKVRANPTRVGAVSGAGATGQPPLPGRCRVCRVGGWGVDQFDGSSSSAVRCFTRCEPRLSERRVLGGVSPCGGQ
jgi:hypothetical protein